MEITASFTSILPALKTAIIWKCDFPNPTGSPECNLLSHPESIALSFVEGEPDKHIKSWTKTNLFISFLFCPPICPTIYFFFPALKVSMHSLPRWVLSSKRKSFSLSSFLIWKGWILMVRGNSACFWQFRDPIWPLLNVLQLLCEFQFPQFLMFLQFLIQFSTFCSKLRFIYFFEKLFLGKFTTVNFYTFLHVLLTCVHILQAAFCNMMHFCMLSSLIYSFLCILPFLCIIYACL